jgi:sensor histidine kinase regulating citrate/malate metabolism
MKDKDRIKQLEQQLKEAKEYTYVHETSSLHCENGELHIGYGDDLKWLIFNVESLYSDLPFIINQVVKEQKQQQTIILKRIKGSITKL